ncbi:hypothetical protein L1887_34528 [Cichorium endivia]|nr:hypothetical protein L1887_34528 [Cichorium endivia]
MSPSPIRPESRDHACVIEAETIHTRLPHLCHLEGAVPPLVALLQSGIPRAMEKVYTESHGKGAKSLLSFLRNQSHGNEGRG